MTETDIINGCKKKKARFQEALVHRYGPMLMTVCLRYSNQSLAQDILQESLVKILNSIKNYEPSGSFEAWMRKITIYTALQYIDKKWWKYEVNLEELPSFPQTDQQVLEAFNAEEILKLIQQLPDGFKQVFNLYVIEGYSHKEIGGLLGIKESTSRSQLTRARQLLQKALSSCENTAI